MSISLRPAWRNVSCVPQRAQNVRVPDGLDANFAGWPWVIWNSSGRTLNHVTKGAPVVRRQIEQWQLVALNGAPVTL